MFEENDETSLEREISNNNNASEENVQINVTKKRKRFDNLKIRYKKDKKKYLVTLSAILAMLSMTMGSSYAYLTYISKTDNTVILDSGTLALTFQNEENVISILNAVPMKDQVGLEQEEEYSFDIKNNGSIPATYKITLDNTCESGNGLDLCIPDEYIKVGIKVGNEDYKVIEKNENDEYVIETGSILANDYNKYKMKIWLDYNTPDMYNAKENQSIAYKGKLGLTYEQGREVIITFDANGGSIPRGTDWIGSGKTATKELTANSTYGTLPTPIKDGLTFKGWSLLPDGYKQVEYIKSSGREYIATDIIPTDTTGAYIKLSSENITTDSIYFGSAVVNGNSNSNRFWIGNKNSNMYFGWNGITTTDKQPKITANEINEAKINYMNSRQIILNEELVDSISSTLNTNNNPITIFAGNRGTSINYHASIKLYQLNISNNNMISNSFIPCVKDNKAGLYDILTNRFYENSGTGDFAIGSMQYITSSDEIVEASNYTLTAVWE